jgi:hypothetical protein
MRKMLGGREPRDFQVEMVQAQEEGQDALCHAATGSGKTAIAAGPYVLTKNQGRVTFMVSPLIGLQNEMVSLLSPICQDNSYFSKVETFKTDFNLTAIAVNSSRGPCTPDIVKVRILRFHLSHDSHSCFALDNTMFTGYLCGTLPDCPCFTGNVVVSALHQRHPSQPHPTL